MNQMTRVALAFVVPAALLIGWEAAGMMQALPNYLPPPTQIGLAFVEISRSGELWQQSSTSLMRAAVGLALGAVTGIVLGLLTGSFRPLRDLVEPLIIALNPIPKIALLPIFVIAFGLGNGSKFAIIGAASFFPVYIAVVDGMTSIPIRLIWVSKSMGVGTLRLLLQVCLPAILPAIFSGLRIAAALSFIVLFAAELIGSKDGLGYLISTAESGLRFDLVFVAIIVIGALGFASDRLLLILRHFVLRGQSSTRRNDL